MRPVVRGLCSYEALVDGTLDICDIANMNDELDVIAENDRRVAEWRENNRGNRWQ
jgi:hypothetical protein